MNIVRAIVVNERHLAAVVLLPIIALCLQSIPDLEGTTASSAARCRRLDHSCVPAALDLRCCDFFHGLAVIKLNIVHAIVVNERHLAAVVLLPIIALCLQSIPDLETFDRIASTANTIFPFALTLTLAYAALIAALLAHLRIDSAIVCVRLDTSLPSQHHITPPRTLLLLPLLLPRTLFLLPLFFLFFLFFGSVVVLFRHASLLLHKLLLQVIFDLVLRLLPPTFPCSLRLLPQPRLLCVALTRRELRCRSALGFLFLRLPAYAILAFLLLSCRRLRRRRRLTLLCLFHFDQLKTPLRLFLLPLLPRPHLLLFSLLLLLHCPHPRRLLVHLRLLFRLLCVHFLPIFHP